MESTTSTTLGRAEGLVDLKRYDEARALLATVLADDPTHTKAWCLLGYCAHAQEDYAGTLHAVEQALAGDPGNEWAWRLRSVALRKTGHEVEALAAARESVRLAPNSWMPYMTLALALNCRPATRDEAWTVARRAVELAPHEAESHFVVGLVASSRRDLKWAKVAYRRALSLDPEHARARNNLALLQLRQGRTAEAATTLSAAAASDPTLKQVPTNFQAVMLLIIHHLWISVLGLLLLSLAVAHVLTADGVLTPVDSVPASAGPALAPRLGVAALMAAAWLALCITAARRYPPSVRRYLLRLPLRRRALAGLLSGIALSAAGALALVCVPLLYVPEVASGSAVALVATRVAAARVAARSLRKA